MVSRGWKMVQLAQDRTLLTNEGKNMTESEDSSPPRYIPDELLTYFNDSEDYNINADPSYISEDNPNDLSGEDPVARHISKCLSCVESSKQSCSSGKSDLSNLNFNVTADSQLHGEINTNNYMKNAVDKEAGKTNMAQELETTEHELVEVSSDDEFYPLTKRGENKIRGLKGDTRKKRVARKTAHNSGQEYYTTRNKGKRVKARVVKPLSDSRNKCREIISEENHKKLFEMYWGMCDFNRRLSYLANLIEIQDKTISIKRTADEDCSHYRQITVFYYVEIESQKLKICKFCFLKVFDESQRFIETVIKKKRFSSISIVQQDERGHAVPKHKLPDTSIKKVQEFLLSIPSYESHYTSRDCSKTFLPSHFTLTGLYEEFKKENPDKKVSWCIFEREFHTLKHCIKKPQIDTSSYCDKLTLKLKIQDGDMTLLKEERDNHLKEADNAFEQKKKDKALTKEDESKQTLTFDLQQCLPTPFVQSSVAFYMRQLWTFNLTIHNCDNGQPYCYLWHEGVAGRGANEIGSSLYSYLTDISPVVQHVIIYSDKCAGQNRNSHVAVMCLIALQNSDNLKVIDHKFLIPGHTHMECDGDHSLIERKRKNMET